MSLFGGSDGDVWDDEQDEQSGDDVQTDYGQEAGDLEQPEQAYGEEDADGEDGEGGDEEAQQPYGEGTLLTTSTVYYDFLMH